MTGINDQYFVIEAENNDNQPMLAWGSSSRPALRKIASIATIDLKLAKQLPENPEMVDYHVLPRPVISSALKQALNNIELKDVQFIPARIKTPGKVYDNYYLLHMYNLIRCLDVENSDCDIDEDLNDVEDIRRFLLDEKRLSEIELNKRLLFVMWEYPSLYICHDCIKRKLESINPAGIRFIPIN